MSERRIDALVLGATGYVGGELLRLLAAHPRLRLRAAVSRSAAGEAIGVVFPHLEAAFAAERFCDPDGLDGLIEDGEGPLAVFGCLPHGQSAATLDRLLARAAGAGRRVALVDCSADFRLPSISQWEAVYGREHAAPARIGDFTCALPELFDGVPEGPVAHPGCFTTAVTLAAAPLAALADGPLCVSAVTGSTGSGREPKAGTHHPERHGDLRAYGPLAHRHAPEMEMLLARIVGAGAAPRVLFVPHSGPFARGIHATIHVRLREPVSSAALLERLAAFYASAPFVTVSAEPPRLKQVVGSNRCRIGAAADGRDAVVFSTIDNLIKGAAGGAVQWANRLLGIEETAGLTQPAMAWI